MLDETWFWVSVAIVGGLLLGSIAGIGTRRLLDNDKRRPSLREIAQPLSLFVFWLCVGAGLVIVGASILAFAQLGVDTTILNILIAAAAFGVALALAGIAIAGGQRVAADLAVGRTLEAEIRPPLEQPVIRTVDIRPGLRFRPRP